MEQIRSVYWEAPEHRHIEKTNDWYWILGIISVSGSVASIIFGNVLFGIVIALATITIFITAGREPRIVPFEVSARGVRVDEILFPYSTLDSFYLDEENPSGPQLLVKSKKLFTTLIVIPVPEEYMDAIEDIIAPRLQEEHLEEPLAHRIMEFFGF